MQLHTLGFNAIQTPTCLEPGAKEPNLSCLELEKDWVSLGGILSPQHVLHHLEVAMQTPSVNECVPTSRCMTRAKRVINTLATP
jgi:hypothetical protein